MAWTDKRAEMSEEDKFSEALNALPHRDQMVTIVAMLFGSVVFEQKKPERSHFVDLTFAALSAVKHTAEMDLIKFLAERFAKMPEGQSFTREQFLATLAMMQKATAKVVEEKLSDTQRLASLLEVS